MHKDLLASLLLLLLLLSFCWFFSLVSVDDDDDRTRWNACGGADTSVDQKDFINRLLNVYTRSTLADIHNIYTRITRINRDRYIIIVLYYYAYINMFLENGSNDFDENGRI